MMFGMKAKLDKRLDYLNPQVRRRVIDDVLQALVVPTPFMVETGARALYDVTSRPLQTRVQACFEAMIVEAQEGG